MSQLSDSASHQPEDRLRLFIAAMEQWESESWRAMKQAERTPSPNSYEAPARQRLIPIFEEFCTPKKRAYGRVENLSLAQPSDYCSAGLVLKSRQLTARRGLASQWVFVLLKQDGRWLVDNKKALNDDGSESSWWL